MKVLSFSVVEIQEVIDKLYQFAKTKFPDKPFTTEILIWEDNTFSVIISNKAEYPDVIDNIFLYKFEDKRYLYQKRAKSDYKILIEEEL